MTKKKSRIALIEAVEPLILTLRGERVMLDADLARVYGVSTKRLNEQIKRNAERFPLDFVFRLTQQEKDEVVANCDHLKALKFSKALPLAFSGGGHWPDWPPQASQFLKGFVPLQKPPNFQLVADELASRFGFQRHRQSVAVFVRTHFPNRLCQPAPRPKARRRWERARLGELWQHDSSHPPVVAGHRQTNPAVDGQ